MTTRPIFSILSAWLVFLFLTGTVAADTGGKGADYCFSTAWPHEQSDLQPDPGLRFGRLDNGMRYVLQEHGEPRDRTALYLGVLAGSLHEEEEQRGLAHFLEHMLFNGSTHFPPGELIDYFQSIGMSYGGDTNAHTSYDETVYKIILPKSGQWELDRGLLVMSDFARGALLLESEVERERGVILAEMTARDSAGYRAWVAESGFTLRGTRAAERMVIGKREVLEQAGRQELKAYYDAWYRPENMILVMVGDFQLQTAEELVAKHFAPLRGEGPAPSCPDPGRLEHREIETFQHYEPELGYTEVIVETVSNKEPQSDSFDLQRQNIHRLMAVRMINHRLTRLTEESEAPFGSASYYDSVMFDRFRISGVRAKTSAGNWQRSLAEIDRVIRQALAHGFSAEELDRVKRQLLSELEQAVQTSETRNSLAMGRRLFAHLKANRVPQSPDQEIKLFGPVVAEATPELVHQVLQADWRKGARLVKVIGDAAPIPADGPESLPAYYRLLQDKPVAEPAEFSAVVFPYLPILLSPVLPTAVESFDDIEALRYRFANGLIVNSKQTDFKKNSVTLTVHFGHGRATLPLPGLDLLAEAVVNGSGTGRYKKSQLQEALDGSSVRHGFRIGEESFYWEGQALTEDLELLFQVLQAVVRDPGFHPDAYELAMKNFALMYQQLESDSEGGVRLYLEPFFAGGIPGYGLPDWSAFSSLTLQDVKQWLVPSFRQSPLEISVVGDVDPEQVSMVAGRYFGSELPLILDAATVHEPQFPTGATHEAVMTTSIDKGIILTAWLTDDFWDISRSRRLHVLAAVFEDRLRRVVREKLGASYSPFVGSRTSRAHAGFGMMMARVVVESALIDTIRLEIERVAASLLNEPVTMDELQRAKRPLGTSLKEAVRTNDYWLHSVLSLSARHPEQLRWPLTMIDDFAAVSADEIEALAARYLVKERQATGIIRPVAPSHGSAGTED